MSPRNSEGLTLRYRAWYRFRYTMLAMLGPAQLSGSQNPLEQLRRERRAKVQDGQGAGGATA